MDMLGHEHVPNQCKSVSGTNLIQNLYQAVARTDTSEIRPPPIATEGDERQVARSIKSPQSIAFRFFHANRQVNIRTLRTEGCATRPVYAILVDVNGNAISGSLTAETGTPL